MLQTSYARRTELRVEWNGDAVSCEGYRATIRRSDIGTTKFCVVLDRVHPARGAVQEMIFPKRLKAGDFLSPYYEDRDDARRVAEAEVLAAVLRKE